MALIFVLGAACGPSPGRQHVQVWRISGSATLGEQLMPQLVYAFMESSGYALRVFSDTLLEAERADTLFVVRIEALGTSVGLDALREGRADMAMSSEALPDSLPGELGSLLLGYDPLAFIVHRHNPVRRLSLQQLQGIFAGELRDWAALSAGRYPGRIHLHVRDGRSGTAHTFDRMIGASAFHDFAKAHAQNSGIYEDVRRDFYAFGYISAAALGERAAVGRVSLEADAGTLDALRRPLRVYHGRPSSAFGRAFLSFLARPESRQIVGSMGFELD